jgi:hypothetical protein
MRYNTQSKTLQLFDLLYQSPTGGSYVKFLISKELDAVEVEVK